MLIRFKPIPLIPELFNEMFGSVYFDAVCAGVAVCAAFTSKYITVQQYATQI